MKKQMWSLLAGCVAASVVTGLYIPSHSEAAAPILTLKVQSTPERLRVEQLEAALQPTTALDAVKLFVRSYETRNGALLFAILDKELQKQELQSFTEQNWVIGGSSPWVKGYRITNASEQEAKPGLADYEVTMFEYTSQGFVGTETLKLTVKQVDGTWVVSKYQPATLETNMNLQAEKLTEKTLLALLNEAHTRFWYVMGGGKGYGNFLYTFKPEHGNGSDYRYLSEDIGTKDKLENYLGDVYATKAVDSYLKKQFADKRLVDEEGLLAQPNGDAGSILEWKKATVVSLKQTGQKATAVVKVPVGDTGQSDQFTVNFETEEQTGWRISSPIEDVH